MNASKLYMWNFIKKITLTSICFGMKTKIDFIFDLIKIYKWHHTKKKEKIKSCEQTILKTHWVDNVHLLQFFFDTTWYLKFTIKTPQLHNINLLRQTKMLPESDWYCRIFLIQSNSSSYILKRGESGMEIELKDHKWKYFFFCVIHS